MVDSRECEVQVPPEIAFLPIQRIGGQTGWYYANWLWKLRGWLDLLVGGIGLRRGRRDPIDLRLGDTVDCWRVEAIEVNRRLRLFAEMRLPGRAWLEFEVEPAGNGSRIRQTAVFDPVGLTGLVYWYSIYPLHEIVFGGMLKSLATAANSNVKPVRRRATVAKQLLMLAVFILICFAVAGCGAYVTAMSVNGWYQTLNKPSWNPPDWIFGPVWTALYLMMAIAAWLVWRDEGRASARSPLGWFAIQLGLNLLWSIVFFGMRQPGWAFGEIVLLWLTISITIRRFHAHSVLAAALMFPYLIWTTFAAVLNFWLWSMN